MHKDFFSLIFFQSTSRTLVKSPLPDIIEWKAKAITPTERYIFIDKFKFWDFIYYP